MERHLTLPGPDEPLPEVRVAQGVTTTLRFDAPIERASVEVQGGKERFLLVDVGERSLLLEPSLEPRPGERLSLTLRYRGPPPEQATFWLVSHPTHVDGEVKVDRHSRSPHAPQERCEAEGPTALVFSGLLDSDGVTTQHLTGFSTDPLEGLRVLEGTGYRATRWALASLRVLNLPGQKPWAPGPAQLRREDGTQVRARVRLNTARLASGETGLLAVETEAPSWPVEEALRLELLDASGTRRFFTNISF